MSAPYFVISLVFLFRRPYCTSRTAILLFFFPSLVDVKYSAKRIIRTTKNTHSARFNITYRRRRCPFTNQHSTDRRTPELCVLNSFWKFQTHCVCAFSRTSRTRTVHNIGTRAISLLKSIITGSTKSCEFFFFRNNSVTILCSLM